MHFTGARRYGGMSKNWGCREHTTPTNHSTATVGNYSHSHSCRGRPLNQRCVSWKTRLPLTHSNGCVRTFAPLGWSRRCGHQRAGLCSIALSAPTMMWHRRINARANRSNPHLYLLLQLLAGDSALVNAQLTLLKESSLIR